MIPTPTAPAGPLLTPRLSLRQATRQHAPALLAYHLANRAHLRPWEPARSDAFYTAASTEERLAAMEASAAAGQAVHLLLFDRTDNSLVGTCNFTNIVRGAFQACHLGFSVAQDREGQGLMRECLLAATHFMFAEHGLHRIMANHRPENTRSARLLSSLGFEREGTARAYLKIDGSWADHVLTSLINPAAA
ncbi:GNAT family N-acetyltransferase [Achromobacter ruhlandii]|uniref:GNAT family N-acetyltransferase n=1 Tax=Achromobacter ruhlandii TaxID=72557 RepID=UPI003BA11267